MSNGSIFKDFVNLYPISKTLRFELKPVGKTLEHIEEKGLITQDEERVEKYKKVKKLIDEYHKKFINEALGYVNFIVTKKSKDGTSETKNLLEEFQSLYKNKDDLKMIQAELRKNIITCMKKHNEFKSVTTGDKTLFKGSKDKPAKLEKLLHELPVSFLKESGIGTKEEATELIKGFGSFTTYFKGFHENRKNMYSTEEQGTAISYRLINENLPMFLDNLGTFEKIFPLLSTKIEILQGEFKDIFPYLDIKSMFTLDSYKYVLTQDGIDTYNTILGGYAKEGREEKIKGLNEYINLYNQDQKEKLPFFKKLYKQILSDRGTISFIPEAFETDQEVLDAIREFYILYNGCVINPIKGTSIADFFRELETYNLSNIFIRNDTGLTNLSKNVYGHWRSIEDAWNQEYDRDYRGGIRDFENYVQKREKAFKDHKSFSISEIEMIVTKESEENKGKLTSYLQNIGGGGNDNLIEHIQEKYNTAQRLLTSPYDTNKELSQQYKEVEKIKVFLDSFKELQSFLKPLLGAGNEPEKDERFYGALLPLWEQLDTVTPLYNKVRNYMTKKPYSTEKFKLNFENKGNFLGGWVDSKTENSDNGTQAGGYLLRKNNSIGEYDYYLGISSDTKLFRYSTDLTEQEKSGFERLDYYQLKSASLYNNSYKGNIPYDEEKKFLVNFLNNFIKQSSNNSFKSDKKIKPEESTPKSTLKYIQDKFPEQYKKILSDPEFVQINSRIVTGLKDTMASLVRIPKAKKFSEQEYQVFTEAIDAIDALCKEKHFNYFSVSQHEITEVLNRKEKPLFLFKIVNKDLSFAETYTQGLRKSRGKDNLHTMYFKALMEGNNNIMDIGTGEVFFRRKSIDYKSVILEKGHHSQELQDKFTYPIISNKRYTLDKFQFHLSITMNFQADKVWINNMVNDTLKKSEDYHVIGIDRGERHLLYISVINKYGNIVEQRSLNTIEYQINGQTKISDYHDLLGKKETELKVARKNWNTIENIKELKAGYLSQVVHQIAELIVKYNAIVALEDLNFGFKRGRFKVEKQVYQKFEKALIDKLNYLVFKDATIGESGHLLSALQLTGKFESFRKLGKQSGVLYYIPAWNTSKIDPTTGFVNMIDTRYKSVDQSKEFFLKFDSIQYNIQEDLFEFVINYNSFTSRSFGVIPSWTLCTYGDRVLTYQNKDNGQWESKPIQVTKELKALLSTYEIPYQDGGDLRDFIVERSEKEFFYKLLQLLKLTLQMRNSISGTDIDYLISPVRNRSGDFFDSRKQKSGLPKDADANGAYNIARKGLMLIERIKASSDAKKVDFIITNADWLEYAQSVMEVER